MSNCFGRQSWTIPNVTDKDLMPHRHLSWAIVVKPDACHGILEMQDTHSFWSGKRITSSYLPNSSVSDSCFDSMRYSLFLPRRHIISWQVSQEANISHLRPEWTYVVRSRLVEFCAELGLSAIPSCLGSPDLGVGAGKSMASPLPICEDNRYASRTVLVALTMLRWYGEVPQEP